MNNNLDIEISKEQKKKFTIDRQHKITCFFPEEYHKHLFHRLETHVENTIVDLLVNLSISLREEKHKRQTSRQKLYYKIIK